MLILQCIIGLKSQITDFTNAFSQADIPSGETVFIEIPKDLNRDGVKYGVFIRLKKNLYGQTESAHL